MTIFLTTHRLEEAERLCDRVAILSTTLRLIGRPDKLRNQLFRRSLDVRLRAQLDDPKAVLGPVPDVQGWEQAPSGCTPVGREEFLIAKALAAFVSTLVIAYAVFGLFLAVAALFAHPVIAAAIYAGTHVLVQLLFTPLLAGWAIWVGIAVSARSTDVRVAQQLSLLGSLPPLVIVALMSLNVIAASTALAIGLAVALLVVDLLAWRIVAAMFDRERLVTGRRG